MATMNGTTRQAYFKMIASMTAKRHDINNEPNGIQGFYLGLLYANILQPLWTAFGKENIHIESGFRSQVLNSRLGGAYFSEHLKGMAIDIDQDAIRRSNAEVFFYIKNNLPFTQLIWEFGDNHEPAWVHVSYNPTKLAPQQGEILIAYKDEQGQTAYRAWIEDGQ